MTEDVAFKCLIMAYEHRAARLGYIKSWVFRVIFNNLLGEKISEKSNKQIKAIENLTKENEEVRGYN
jgi:hypothetical protein